MARIKLFLIHWLDKLFPDKYCWTDLVFWAEYSKPWSEVDRPEGCGYCGKCNQRKLGD